MSNLIIPHSFSNTTTADATQVNANFNQIVTLLNSTGLDSSGLAANSVTTAKILDANVTTAKILDANVTTAKILDANVTTAKLADGAVTAAKITAGTITADRLVAGTAMDGASTAQANSLISKTDAAAKISGKYPVVSNSDPISASRLGIIRGRVAADGAITTGEGCTAAWASNTVCNVTFSTAFADAPSVTACPEVSSAVWGLVVNNVATTGVQIIMTGGTHVPFDFIAIGISSS